MQRTSSKHIVWLTILGGGILGILAYAGWQYHAFLELRAREERALDGGIYEQPQAYESAWYLVPPEEIYSAGVTEGDIPLLDHPAQATISEIDEKIGDAIGGVSVTLGGETRFYPVQIMNWHHGAYDTLGGQEIFVYAAPLTGTATAYLVPRGEKFVVSGKEYNNDVLLRKEGSEQYWSGIFGRPVVAESQASLEQSLERIPVSYMTWKSWKSLYGGDARATTLSFATGVERDYMHHPYGGYETSSGYYFPLNHAELSVRPKEPAWVAVDGASQGVAILTPTLASEHPTATSAGKTFLFTANEQGTTLRAFIAEHNGSPLTLTKQISPQGTVFVDAETGSSWNADGVAISGSLSGERLREVPTVRMYSFVANALYPSAAYVAQDEVMKKEGQESDIPAGAVQVPSFSVPSVEVTP